MNSEIPLAYERIERRLETLIKTGTLVPGDRIPSIRELCRTENVSPSTVIQALANLEARSLIRARQRSGFFVETPLPIPLPSDVEVGLKPTRTTVSDDVARVFQDLSLPGVIPLGGGIPDPSLLPCDEVARSVSRAARNTPSDFGRYALGSLDQGFRQEIAKRLARTGCTVAPEEVVVTNGCMEALNLAIRAVAGPGDVVAVESPAYFGILEMIESLGMQSLPVPSTCRLGLDLDVLEKSLRKFKVAACLLVPSFGNPNGACMSQQRRERLAEILAKHGIPLIEDDIYGDLYFDEERPRPVKACGEGRDTLLCGSFSKTVSPGLRLGWVAAGRHVEDVRRLKLISSIATSQILSRAGMEFLQSGAYDRHLRKFRRSLETQMNRIRSGIFQAFPEGTAVSRPRGGYFLWVELPGGVHSMRLRDAAKSRKISICPGPIFSTESGCRNFFRINCAVRWGADIERAIWTLGELAKDLSTVRPSKRSRLVKLAG